MNNWKKEGLKELGISEEDYNNLSREEKQDTDKLLKEMGH